MADISFDVTFTKTLDIDIDVGGSSGGRFPYYTGDYDIVPKVQDIVLPTKNKSMSDDVTIYQIPYATVKNPSGGNTVIIGFE